MLKTDVSSNWFMFPNTSNLWFIDLYSSQQSWHWYGRCLFVGKQGWEVMIA